MLRPFRRLLTTNSHPLRPRYNQNNIMSQHNKYIVVFEDNITKEQLDEYVKEVKDNGGTVTNEYDSVFKGFAGHIPDDYLQNLQNLQGGIIKYIEPDQIVSIQ